MKSFVFPNESVTSSDIRDKFVLPNELLNYIIIHYCYIPYNSRHFDNPTSIFCVIKTNRFKPDIYVILKRMNKNMYNNLHFLQNRLRYINYFTLFDEKFNQYIFNGLFHRNQDKGPAIITPREQTYYTYGKKYRHYKNGPICIKQVPKKNKKFVLYLDYQYIEHIYYDDGDNISISVKIYEDETNYRGKVELSCSGLPEFKKIKNPYFRNIILFLKNKYNIP